MGPFLNMADAKAAVIAEGFTWVDPPFGHPWRVDGMTFTSVLLFRDHGHVHATISRITYAPGSDGAKALASYALQRKHGTRF